MGLWLFCSLADVVTGGTKGPFNKVGWSECWGARWDDGRLRQVASQKPELCGKDTRMAPRGLETCSSRQKEAVRGCALRCAYTRGEGDDWMSSSPSSWKGRCHLAQVFVIGPVREVRKAEAILRGKLV